MAATATLSPCGTYRFLLTRTWHDDRPKLGWVMLNPSTADADRDDLTIRRCCGLAAREGYGGVVVANLYPLRSTNPERLRTHPDTGGRLQEQMEAIHEVARLAAVVLAWGDHGAHWPGQIHRVVGALKCGRARLLRLGGLTVGGHPRHPLYVPGGVPFVEAGL